MPVENCIVAIGPEGGSRPAGVGFLVTKRHVVTCAHVVNVCVGREKESRESKPDRTVKVAFVADEGTQPLLARVEREDQWLPPSLPGAKSILSDIAILTLERNAPQRAISARLRTRNSLENKRFSVLGFPDTWSNGQSQTGTIGKPILTGRYELLEGDHERQRPFVRLGFSGSPVMCESTTNTGVVGVVGMVVAARATPQEGTAYMMPGQQLRDFLSGLEGVDVCNGVLDDFPHIKLVNSYLKNTVLKTRTGPLFDVRLRRLADADAIAQLFRQDPQDTYDRYAVTPDELLDATDPPLLLVQSPGGAGKSNFLVTLVESAISKGMVPFFLDAAKSNEKMDVTSGNLKALLKSFGVGGGIEDFCSARDEVGIGKIVVLLDRLNENPLRANEILQAIIDAVVHEGSGISVVVTDRVKDRLGSIAPLELATVLPLPREEMAKHLGYKPEGTNAKLLATPFFLEMQLPAGELEGGSGPPTRADMFKEFFRRHAGITKTELPKLAASAFAVYERCKKTVIPMTPWTKTMDLPDELKQQVLDGAMLQYKPENATENVVEFRHQLLHDFLAGIHLAYNEERFWRAPNFDIATLGTQSFDAIEFAAEQLETKATPFLIQVYDWNWLGVLEAVRNLDAGRHGGESPVSPEFKDALYFLNAVRLFDCFEDSRKRTKGIIADVKTTAGHYLESARSFEDLREKVITSYMPKEPYFKEWKDLFLRNDKEPVSIRDLSVLWRDPFMSWTAASVFRKLLLDSTVPDFLQMVYNLVLRTGGDRPEAVGTRWRFVHLLGVVKSAGASDFLWSVTENSNEDKYVRSGAVRSYIENATLAEPRAVRQRMLTRVAEWIRDTQQIPSSVSRQLRTSARLATDSARDGWHSDYISILEAGVKHAESKKDAQDEQAWKQKKDEIGALIAENH